MKVVNDIIEWLVQTGLLSVLAIFLLKQLKPVLDNKAEHASTEQSRALWTLLEQVADMAVTSLVSQDKSGREKFDEASMIVNDVMKKQGYKLDSQVIHTAVQSAYEKSELTPTVNTKEGK
ncbi:phage holin, LLH family [Ligilactobacillus salivarius]|uniref:phage holin, LLH family n=1 Tax=Ligilactobacillus salivarius TaxID=1624 RepID=UPI001370CF6D|nr:phage holin, LLH family [Ligilactobacillus salivarius]MYV25302.1 hypothetical protein [Ligilactobacillus salivarius]